MPSKIKIDKEQALAMMRSGKTDAAIAAHFKKSRQAVNLLRQSFIKHSLLDNTAKQPKNSKQLLDNTPPQGANSNIPTEATSLESTQSLSYPMFDQITDWVIQLIKEAGAFRELNQRCQLLESQNKAHQMEINQLRQELDETQILYKGILTRMNEYQAAIRKLGLPPQKS